MGTTFDDIYCQSRLLKLEKVLSSLPKPMYYSLNFRWLRYAISLFEFDIIPQSKLAEYTPFWEKDFNYVGDGTDTEFAVPYYDVPNSLQIGDNVKGKTIYFNTSLTSTNFGTVFKNKLLTFVGQKDGTVYSIYEFNNDGELQVTKTQNGSEETLISLYRPTVGWVNDSFTLPSDQDYIVTNASTNDIAQRIFGMLASYKPYVLSTYVGVREYQDNSVYVESTNYSYKFQQDHILYTFNTAPSNLSDIWISPYISGQFDNVLTEREITILAEGMVVPFLEENKNNAKLSRTFIYGGSTKMYSTANLLDKNIASADDQRNWVQSLISEYSYKMQYNTQNRLKPLGTTWHGRGRGC